jgi:hypothetical protein
MVRKVKKFFNNAFIALFGSSLYEDNVITRRLLIGGITIMCLVIIASIIIILIEIWYVVAIITALIILAYVIGLGIEKLSKHHHESR